MLDDEELENVKDYPAFQTMKSISDARCTEAVSKTEARLRIICFWRFTETHKTDRQQERTGNRYLQEISSGRSKPYKAPNQTDMEHIDEL